MNSSRKAHIWTNALLYTNIEQKVFASYTQVDSFCPKILHLWQVSVVQNIAKNKFQPKSEEQAVKQAPEMMHQNPSHQFVFTSSDSKTDKTYKA